MDIIDIEVFLLLASSNSISRISEVLHLSQSTISYRINKLEEELGVPLVIRKRGGRTSKLTPYGERFVLIAEQWSSLYKDAQTLKLHPINELTIGVVDSISSSILPEIYKSVLEKDNSLSLNILTRYSTDIYDLVENWIVDIGFVSIPSSRKNIITTPIFTEKYYVVRYKNNPTAPRIVNPEELNSYFQIYISYGNEYDNWHEKLWDSPNNYHICIDSLSLLQQFLVDEQYWAIIPGNAVKQLLSKSHNMQVDKLMLPEDFIKTYYAIKHIKPKESSLNGLRVFEEALKVHNTEFI